MQLLQQKVVDELGAARPQTSIASLCGLPMWNSSSADALVSNNPVANYVKTQAKHHVSAALADPKAAAIRGRRWIAY
eukprot:COSAG05_NODE_13034_length_444_cov_0.831884_1_plen_76_part_10